MTVKIIISFELSAVARAVNKSLRSNKTLSVIMVFTGRILEEIVFEADETASPVLDVGVNFG